MPIDSLINAEHQGIETSVQAEHEQRLISTRKYAVTVRWLGARVEEQRELVGVQWRQAGWA